MSTTEKDLEEKKPEENLAREARVSSQGRTGAQYAGAQPKVKTEKPEQKLTAVEEAASAWLILLHDEDTPELIDLDAFM